MKIKAWAVFVLAASILVVARPAQAAVLPVANPGFDGTVSNTFTFNAQTYHPGDPIPNGTFSGFNGQPAFGNNIALNDSGTGAATGGTATIPGGYTTTSGGVVFDTTNYTAGNGPTGPGGYLTIDGSNVSTANLLQTLVGTIFQPNTKYTLTASVSDRVFGPGDNVSFPTSVSLVFTADGVEQPGATQTFVAPAAGGTSTGTLVFTTGATAPAGNLGFLFRISGFNGGAASQAVFDNVTIDATAVPEPATLAMLAFAAALPLRRRRVL